MVLHYFLLSFKILVLIGVFIGITLCLFSKQKSFSHTKLPTNPEAPLKLKSFVYSLFKHTYTSEYKFANQYASIISPKIIGGGGGGGGGGHGNDDWVMPKIRSLF